MESLVLNYLFFLFPILLLVLLPLLQFDSVIELLGRTITKYYKKIIITEQKVSQAKNPALRIYFIQTRNITCYKKPVF